jgi:sodium transport system ATP-binding protein
MVQTENLSKVFPDKKAVKTAVKDVSFTARPGEIFGLLGVNGAGKTTTLRMLSTVIAPTGGRAFVAGFDVVKSPTDVRRSIGFLSNSTALYGRLTPRETLNYFGKLYGLRDAKLRGRVEFVIETLRLQEFLDRPCDRLSTGQKQRTSIGRAILHDPPVMFFDEPTAGLDVITSQTVMEFIEGARTAGKTVIFSTHIMSEAERLCDRIAIIDNGELRSVGTLADLLAETQAPNLERAFLSMVGYKPEVEVFA